MTGIMEQLNALKKNYAHPEFSKLVSDIRFFIYAVDPGMRIPLVLQLLNERSYGSVSNFHTNDENISVLYSADVQPDILVVEGMHDSAGVSEMVRKFGRRIFSIGFNVSKLDPVVEILRSRGTEFITPEPENYQGIRYISTTRSDVTGDTFMYVERRKTARDYLFFKNAEEYEVEKEIMETVKRKKRLKTFSHIGMLDHVTYRVHQRDTMEAAQEIMSRTPYVYSGTFEIAEAGGIGIVFKKGKQPVSILVTTGLNQNSLIEKWVENNSPRVHHLAYEVTDIQKVVSLQSKRNVQFISQTMPVTQDTLAQAFTKYSELSGDCTEYVERFGIAGGYYTVQPDMPVTEDSPFA